MAAFVLLSLVATVSSANLKVCSTEAASAISYFDDNAMSKCAEDVGFDTVDILSPTWTAAQAKKFSSSPYCADAFASFQKGLANIDPPCIYEAQVSTTDIAHYTIEQYATLQSTPSSTPAPTPSPAIIQSPVPPTPTSLPTTQTTLLTINATTPAEATPMPTSLTNNPTAQTTKSSSSSTIIIVVVLVLALIAGVIGLWLYRRKKNKLLSSEVQIELEEYQTVYTMQQQSPIASSHVHTKPKAMVPVYDNPKLLSTQSIGTGTLTNASGKFQLSCQSFGISNSNINMHDLELHYIPPQHLTLDYNNVIARGAFGEVLLGEYQEQPVAIKKLLQHRRDVKQLQQFIDEISLVAKLDSPYIVQFKGASWTTPADIVLVTEFMDGGDLRTRLENNSDKSFTWTNKIECALSIANALGYLHTLHTKIIHRDLKSRNVLLNSHTQAKVTDFGVSRETDDATMTAGIGTFRWMAPEVLLDNHYTESADMFSFGVILAELSSEIVPYSDKKNASGRPYTDTAIMTQVMKGELLPKFGDDTPSWLLELGLKCLSLKLADRPTALEASHLIKMHLKNIVV